MSSRAAGYLRMASNAALFIDAPGEGRPAAEGAQQMVAGGLRPIKCGRGRGAGIRVPPTDHFVAVVDCFRSGVGAAGKDSEVLHSGRVTPVHAGEGAGCSARGPYDDRVVVDCVPHAMQAPRQMAQVKQDRARGPHKSLHDLAMINLPRDLILAVDAECKIQLVAGENAQTLHAS